MQSRRRHYHGENGRDVHRGSVLNIRLKYLALQYSFSLLGDQRKLSVIFSLNFFVKLDYIYLDLFIDLVTSSGRAKPTNELATAGIVIAAEWTILHTMPSSPVINTLRLII
jgi:hypothetical protein